MKKLDKLKIVFDKKMVIFLITLSLIGLISGSVLVCIINNSDKLLMKEYLINFVKSINNNTINYLSVFKSNIFNTLVYILGIWFLGISIIGLPLILIMYFSLSFVLGFSVGSIIYTYGFKGIIFALIYVFPSQIIKLLCLTILTMFAINFFLKLINALFNKKNINFKITMNKYFIILIIVLVIGIMTSLYDTYAMPYLVKKIIKLLI